MRRVNLNLNLNVSAGCNSYKIIKVVVRTFTRRYCERRVSRFSMCVKYFLAALRISQNVKIYVRYQCTKIIEEKNGYVELLGLVLGTQ